jgi:apolipoprotein D and lipocalin family protein
MPLFLFSCGSSRQLATVEKLDLNQYSGTWYEIARLPNSFETGLECITATYTIMENGKVEVLNKGWNEEDNEWKSVKGSAKRPNEQKPGELKVTFFWPFYGAYYVMWIDDDYNYALVGHPNRKYLWILARNPICDESVLERMKAHATDEGFEVDKMVWVMHKCVND